MLVKIIATAFGAGYSPIAPGTAGALVAAIFLWVADALLKLYLPDWVGQEWPLLVLVIGTTAVGVQVSTAAEKVWGKDPSRVVIDEVVGMWISMLWVPLSGWYLFWGFMLFRLFDIWKPWHVARAEALPAGWGIMMDDVVAGIYTCIILHLMIYIGS